MARRKGLSFVAVVAASAVLLLTANSFSQQPQPRGNWPVGGGVDVGIVSKYIWRGYIQNEDFALQPDAYLTLGNFLASVWGSLDMTDRDDVRIDSQGDFSEIDYVLQYTIPANLLNLSFGYSLYTYPNTPDEIRKSTQEVYARGGFKVFLEPTVELFYDMDEVEGWYGRASATYTQRQNSQEWKLRGSVGFASEEFANYYFGGRESLFDSSSFCDLEVRLFTTFDLGLNFGLTPFVGVSYLLDSEIRDAYNDDGEFFGGLNVSWSF